MDAHEQPIPEGYCWPVYEVKCPNCDKPDYVSRDPSGEVFTCPHCEARFQL